MILDQETRDLLRQFKPGTPIMLKSGEFIGHVVGYSQMESSTPYDEWKTKGRWIYMLRVLWADDTEETIEYLNDIQLL